MFKKIALIILLLSPSLLFAQTCHSNAPKTTPTALFTVNNDGTALDTTTGLVWKVCSEGQTWANSPSCTGAATSYNWKAALDTVKTLNNTAGFAGKTDWRLPNIKELASITELQCVSPAINLTIFPDTPPSVFFSSSPFANFGGGAWVLDFNDGFDKANFKKNVKQVRLVRSSGQ